MGQEGKQRLRDQIMSAFLEKDEVYFAEANRKINQRLVKMLQRKSGVTIGVYLAVGGEADLTELIVHLQSIPKIKLAIPKVTDNQMEFFLFTEETALIKNKWGICEPQETGESIVPDVILIPGLAFSSAGQRLGRGLGYFDRFLQESEAERIGVCFDFQINENIPTEPHDQDMDIIVTNK